MTEGSKVLEGDFAVGIADAADERLTLPAHSAPARALPRAEVTISIHADLAEVEAGWRAFERVADCTPFQTFGWLSKWQQHLGAPRHVRPVIVCGRDEAGLVFILPLAVERTASLRRLTWLGSTLSDYNAPLLAPEFCQKFGGERFAPLWEHVLALLQADPRSRFDVIDLRKMAERVGGQRNPLLMLPLHANPSSAYVATLVGDWEKFYAAKRSSSTRKRERRQLRQLGAQGEVCFIEPQSGEEMARTLEALFAQKGQAFRRMGVRNVFARPQYREFYRDLATDPDTAPLVHVSRLDVGAEIAAAGVGLKFRSSYALILSSYADGEISRHGPGRAYLHMLMQHAIAQRFEKFDFTIGDEPYKRDWSDVELRLYDHLSAATLSGRVMAMTAAAARHTKRQIKQNPTLWRAFARMRALAGGVRRRP